MWVAYMEHQFFEKCISEIMDLNVLPAFRKQVVGSKLLDVAEEMASTKTGQVGIGVGLYGDYGSAQRLYVKHGYVPDGRGVTYNYQPITPGNKVALDDELVLWFVKRLK